MPSSLLLLSGLLCDETLWADIPQRLAEATEVTVVSFRGFSSIQAMSEHVLKVAPASFSLAGHSMGGRVALEIIRSAPQRVQRLALLNTSVQSVRDGEPQSRQLLLRLAHEHGMAALGQEWLPPMLGKSLRRNREVLPLLQAMVERCSHAEYALQVHAMLHRPDALTALSAIKVPTLLLGASDDAWSPMSQYDAVRRRVRQATLFEVHDAGHMAPIERPLAVALALKQWLSGSEAHVRHQ
jgi:pimeloyl-ACP methyl ester carboxylesterase